MEPWFVVTTDTYGRDGAQLFGFEGIKLQAGDERLGDDDAPHAPTVLQVAHVTGVDSMEPGSCSKRSPAT